MKIYSYYTESHEVLFRKYLSPTVPPGFALVSKKGEQLGALSDHVFGTDEFFFTNEEKIRFWLEASRESRGDWFIFCDVDIQFFPKAAEIIRGIINKSQADLLFQHGGKAESGWQRANAGFMICKGSPKIEAFWEEVLQMRRDRPEVCDQTAANILLRSGSRWPRRYRDLRWGFLPKRLFIGGHALDRVSPRMAMHHATRTSGVAEKIQQLDLVRERYDALAAKPGWFRR